MLRFIGKRLVYAIITLFLIATATFFLVAGAPGDPIAAKVGQMPEQAQEIISAFEEKQQLSELVTQTLAKEDNTGIQVYIGDETPVQTMRDCSVVTATYELGDGMKGTIGIIGPKRMDYEHVLKSMKRLQTELDQMFHKNDRKVE